MEPNKADLNHHHHHHHRQSESEAASKLNLYSKLTQLVSKYETLNQEIYEFKLPDSSIEISGAGGGANFGEPVNNHWISFYDYDNYEYFAIEQFQKEHEAFLKQLKTSEDAMNEKNSRSHSKQPTAMMLMKTTDHSTLSSYADASISSSNAEDDYSLEMFYSVSDSFPTLMN